jgi:hypothetical protein
MKEGGELTELTWKRAANLNRLPCKLVAINPAAEKAKHDPCTLDSTRERTSI